MDLREIITAILIFGGAFLFVVAAIGILRFPDFFARMHPAGKSDTFGNALVLVGLMVFEGFTLVSLKLLFIVIFIFIANPTATHALAKAALADGLVPWTKGDRRR